MSEAHRTLSLESSLIPVSWPLFLPVPARLLLVTSVPLTCRRLPEGDGDGPHATTSHIPIEWGIERGSSKAQGGGVGCGIIEQRDISDQIYPLWYNRAAGGTK